MAEEPPTHCLICYTTKSSLDPGSPSSCETVQDHITSVSRQLHVIFILRKLFQVPLKNLEEYLSTVGNPDEWIWLCPNCTEDTENAKQIYSELLQVSRKFRSFRTELIETVKITYKSRRKTNEADKKAREEKDKNKITDEIRCAISKSACRADTDPFVAGDQKAKELGRRSQPFKGKRDKNVIFDLETADSPFTTIAISDDNDYNPSSTASLTDDYEDDSESVESKSSMRIQKKTITKHSRKKYKNKVSPCTCSHCQKVLSSAGALRTHIKICHTPPSHFCHVCGKGYTLKPYLDRHLVRSHQVGNHLRRACEVEGCGRFFYTEQLLNFHMDQHNKDPKFKCDKCGKMFYFPHKLKRHLDSVHNFVETRPFRCEHCGASYKRQDALHDHLKRFSERGACTFPRKRSRTPPKFSTDKIGQNTFPARPVVCHYCGKVFRSRISFHCHVKFTHLRNYPVVCDICGKGMRSHGCLKRHRALHHNIGDSCEFLKQCTFPGCGKWYLSEFILKYHRTIHEKKPSFQCEQCSKWFYFKHRLQRHRKLHVDKETRPYPCHVCGKTYARADYIKLHMKSHAQVEVDQIQPKT